MVAVEYSDEFRRMLGYSRTELPDAIEALGGLIHPEETEAVFGAFAAAAADKNKKYDIDYRLLTKSGAYKWFHAAGECLRFHNGTPKEFIGTFSDIDEKKRNEEIFEHDSRRQKAVELIRGINPYLPTIQRLEVVTCTQLSLQTDAEILVDFLLRLYTSQQTAFTLGEQGKTYDSQKHCQYDSMRLHIPNLKH